MTAIHRPLALLATLLALPALAQDLIDSVEVSRAVELAPPPGPAGVVAEALFLPDTLPPGGTELNVAASFERAAPDDGDGHRTLRVAPGFQLAQALGGRAGFTADVGLSPDGDRLVDPAASLKVLVLDGGETGLTLSASADWMGTFEQDGVQEGGLALGLMQPLGGITVRASAQLASPVDGWQPHAHGGLSGALALGSRWHALLELAGDTGADDDCLSLGPSLKAQLGEATALMFGGLFRVAGAHADPLGVVQLTVAL
ncbi:MAG: hypothetical protein QM767_04025 [Anaeromyxobacter sp.]